MKADDHLYMTRALQLARRGLSTTTPNPRVGCVLVGAGGIIGEGWHEWAGEPHAEINALQGAGDAAAGATAYVTLEPCCHHGRTPPCTDALIEAGVERVVIAMEDPNPRVAGQGIGRLRAAGIRVDSGLLADQAEELNPGFVRRMRTGYPVVRCKLAMSVDGRTAMASGESKWITGDSARRDVQSLRARSCAIMTGIGTVLADDPSLNVRRPASDGRPPRQPVRVVIDPELRMPASARMLSLPGKTLVFTGSDEPGRHAVLQDAGARVLNVSRATGGLDLRAVLKRLGDMDINEVLLEAGATLSGGMLQAGLVDELVIYMAPYIMGAGARGLFQLTGLERMEQRVSLEIIDLRAVGSDWRISARPLV